MIICSFFSFFFFNDTATTEIYTLSLHDALPIWSNHASQNADRGGLSFLFIGRSTYGQDVTGCTDGKKGDKGDRKSTRLNSSHMSISYAVFCLKKKKKKQKKIKLKK